MEHMIEIIQLIRRIVIDEHGTFQRNMTDLQLKNTIYEIITQTMGHGIR